MPRAQGCAKAATFCFALLKKSWTDFFSILLGARLDVREIRGRGMARAYSKVPGNAIRECKWVYQWILY